MSNLKYVFIILKLSKPFMDKSCFIRMIYNQTNNTTDVDKRIS